MKVKTRAKRKKGEIYSSSSERDRCRSHHAKIEMDDILANYGSSSEEIEEAPTTVPTEAEDGA